MKKYEFTGETKKIGILGDITVRRIRATIEFGTVKAGDLGGWIEKEANLSQEGYAWICGNAEVYGDARVYGNAKVYGNARVYGDARVCGDAEVYGNARVCGDARVLQTSHILVIGPIGSRESFITFYRDKDNEITIKCGCFTGKIDTFMQKVKETHGDSRYARAYRAATELARTHISLD